MRSNKKLNVKILSGDIIVWSSEGLLIWLHGQLNSLLKYWMLMVKRILYGYDLWTRGAFRQKYGEGSRLTITNNSKTINEIILMHTFYLSMIKYSSYPYQPPWTFSMAFFNP